MLKNFFKCKNDSLAKVSGGMVKWLMRWCSNLRIAERMSSNPIWGKLLFP